MKKFSTLGFSSNNAGDNMYAPIDHTHSQYLLKDSETPQVVSSDITFTGVIDIEEFNSSVADENIYVSDTGSLVDETDSLQEFFDSRPVGSNVIVRSPNNYPIYFTDTLRLRTNGLKVSFEAPLLAGPEARIMCQGAFDEGSESYLLKLILLTEVKRFKYLTAKI